MILLMLCASQAHAAFFVHRQATVVVGSSPVHIYHAPAHPQVADDSWKGIVATVASGIGALSLILALMIPAVGLIFPGFLFGVAGIVFGALPKKHNKGLGHLGLILGIVDVLLVLAFIAIVAIALASFT